MLKIRSWWMKLSISNKLLLAAGIMATLIATELFTLRFAMRTLSAVRAFVGGEGLWSKAQKDAVLNLQRYYINRKEEDFQAFLKNLEIPEGDHQARIELMKADANLDIITQGFIKGQIHPHDIAPMVQLLVRFHTYPYLREAIDVWRQGDELLQEIRSAGLEFHKMIQEPNIKSDQVSAALGRIESLNQRLTVLETEFSNILGEGSRTLESILLSVLFAAVVAVEGIGLTLTISTTRSITRRLRELNEAARRIGKGELEVRVRMQSTDELGQLGNALDEMADLLQKSYSHLEDRVKARTVELNRALKGRDEFISVASHELRTPLTALFLNLQILDRTMTDSRTENKRAIDISAKCLMLAKRMTSLIDELLDITHMRIGKLELRKEISDAVAIAKEAISQVKANPEWMGAAIILRAPDSTSLHCDPTRLLQILTNLISNAVKYGNQSSVLVHIERCGDQIQMEISDQGQGIALEDQDRIFEQFERLNERSEAEGLGLGLFITKQLTEAHGGSISLKSKPGEGSTFTVLLPVQLENFHTESSRLTAPNTNPS